MRKNCLLIILYLICQYSFGQDYYDTLDKQCLQYRNSARYESMLQVSKEMLNWSFSKETDTSLRYATALRKVGLSFFHLQQLDSAEFYYKWAASCFMKQKRELHPGYASTLNNLGLLYSQSGEFRAAESYCLQALAVRKKTIGENNPEYAGSINNLGLLYYNMGDYKAAEEQYVKALEIWKTSVGELNTDYVNALGNLSNLYKEMGIYQKAVEPGEKALQLRKKLLGEIHPAVASSYNDLGGLYQVMNQYDSVEAYFNHALNIRKLTLGERHPEYASTLNNLGNYYWSKGLAEEAEKHIQKALEITAQALGVKHPSYLATEDNYAQLLTRTGREREALTIFQEKYATKMEAVQQNFQWLSEQQKEAYWKQESSFYDYVSWFANTTSNHMPEASELNYNSALLAKGFLLETKLQLSEATKSQSNQEVELSILRKKQIQMESEGAETSAIEQLTKQADSLDKVITLAHPEYSAQKQNLGITCRDVQEALSDGEAAIEFVRFFDDADSSFKYNALIITRGAYAPQLVQLCKESDLEGILPNQSFSTLYPLVWKPLEEHLDAIHTVYYAPTGLLTNVPFHALYRAMNEGDIVTTTSTNKRGVSTPEATTSEADAAYLMDRYTLHQLTSTRYLATGIVKNTGIRMPKTITLAGGIDYDFLPGKNAAKTRSSKTETKHAKRSSDAIAGRLAYLPGTLEEIQTIEQRLTPMKWEVQRLEGIAATEEKIVSITDGQTQGVIHLATHGYAFPEGTKKNANETAVRQFAFRFSKNPMVRSGVILSGGNWAWTGNDTLKKLGMQENGILTALEVSQLNLRNTKLVVLSACETGLGKIEGAEGTFGLKRGFKLAGVEQIIVSLWSVPDKETMELMTAFYDDLSQSLDPVKSFQNAQHMMRQRYPNRPDLWAGFVLIR